VLSFAGPGGLPDRNWLLGELVLCAPVIAAEARLQGKRLEAHWAHLTVHGVLHLLGFDHEGAVQAAEMESKEVQILDRIGFSDPYV
jgi:probable rRNA maturation factor